MPKVSRWQRLVDLLLTCGRGNPEGGNESSTSRPIDRCSEVVNERDDTGSPITVEQAVQVEVETDDSAIANNVLDSSAKTFMSITPDDRIPIDAPADTSCHEAESGYEKSAPSAQNEEKGVAAKINYVSRIAQPVQASLDNIDVEHNQGRGNMASRGTASENLLTMESNSLGHEKTRTTVDSCPEIRSLRQTIMRENKEVLELVTSLMEIDGQDVTEPTAEIETPQTCLTSGGLTSPNNPAVKRITAEMVEEALYTLEPVVENDYEVDREVSDQEDTITPTFYQNVINCNPEPMQVGANPAVQRVVEGSTSSSALPTPSDQFSQNALVRQTEINRSRQQNSSSPLSVRQSAATQSNNPPTSGRQSFQKPLVLSSSGAIASPNPNNHYPVTSTDTNAAVANSYASPRRSREAIPNMHRSASVPPASSLPSSLGITVDHLSSKGIINGYQPIPEDIRQFVTQAARAKRVECGAIYQSPKNPMELQIIGINASSMSDLVTDTLDQFPGFTFSLQNCKDPRHLIEYGVDAIYDVTKLTFNSRENKYKPLDEAMCGMILVCCTFDTNPIDAHYVVVPAHLVLQRAGEDYRENILEKLNPKSVDEIRELVESKASYDRYVIKLHNSDNKNDIAPNPLFGYRYFHDSNCRYPEWDKFTNDLALLQIKAEQIMGAHVPQPGITREHLKDTMTESKELLFATISGSFEEHCTKIENIFPLRTQDTLVEMGRRRVHVFVGPHVGYMVPCGESISTDGRNWTSAIEFVMLGRKFQPGDCGLIVHVQDRRKPTELYPLGMFVGRSTRTHACGLTIWVAVILRICIDEIQYKYRHLVSDLRPMEKTVDQSTDEQRLVQNLTQNCRVHPPTAECGEAEAVVTVDTGYHDTMPTAASYNHSSMRR